MECRSSFTSAQYQSTRLVVSRPLDRATQTMAPRHCSALPVAAYERGCGIDWDRLPAACRAAVLRGADRPAGHQSCPPRAPAVCFRASSGLRRGVTRGRRPSGTAARPAVAAGRRNRDSPVPGRGRKPGDARGRSAGSRSEFPSPAQAAGQSRGTDKRTRRVARSLISGTGSSPTFTPTASSTCGFRVAFFFAIVCRSLFLTRRHKGTTRLLYFFVPA